MKGREDIQRVLNSVPWDGADRGACTEFFARFDIELDGIVEWVRGAAPQMLSMGMLAGELTGSEIEATMTAVLSAAFELGMTAALLLVAEDTAA